jgi:hypothetical protein
MAQVNQAQVAGGLNAPLETKMDEIIPEPKDFKVYLRRIRGAKFGFTVAQNSHTLRVTSIRDDSECSVALWNNLCSYLNPQHRLQVGHQIFEVNGISGDSTVMMDAFKQCRDIELRVRAVKEMEFLYQMLQHRNLGPSDQELFLRLSMRAQALDESTPAKTGFTRMNVVQMPMVLASDVGVDQCLICFDEYDEDDLVTQLTCKHCFCTKCIGKWLTQGSRRCPLCWQEVHWSYGELW